MDFSAFDTSKLDEYAEEAKKHWGSTDAYKEFEEKKKGRSGETERAIGMEMMDIFVAFGEVKELPPDSKEAQELVQKLRDFITENYYNCTVEILRGLGQLYGAGGDFTENIDKAGGAGTAEFAAAAIDVYCKKA